MFGSILSRIRSNAALLLVGLICIGWPVSSAWAQACPDADSDGYADCTVPGCDDSGLLCGDCDDANGAAYPTQPELCNHFDDNCDGRVDEGFPQPVSARNVTDTADGAPSDYFGFAVAAIGDVDGDGLDDFAVGIYADDSAGGDSGSVLVYSGVDQSILCRAVDPGGAASDWLGYSVAGIGDVTGDGTPDFAAGAPYDDTSEGTNAGSVVLFSGANCAFVRKMTDATGAASDYLGFSVAGVGDVSGDSTPDLVAGAPYHNTAAGADAGTALVFSGADGSLVHRLEDASGGAAYRLGSSVAGVGIIDGDAVPDIAVGAPYDSTLANAAGSVVLFSGAAGTDIRKLTDGSGSDNLGYSVAGIRDVNSDGVDDVLAGAPYEDSQNTNAGAVVLFSGADGTRLRLLTDPVGNNSDYLGWSVTVMDSLTADGIQEVVVGAQRDDDAAADAGSVLVFDPTNGNVVHKLTDPDGRATDYLGNSVAAVSDLSGDGAPEILAGAHLAGSVEEVDVGKVVIFSFEADCDGDGVSPFGTDCDDTTAANFSGNTEICDGVDNDCDGDIDDDDDGDGSNICADCDPANPLIYPGAPELCNGVDDDCDTFVDNGVDADSDGVETPCDCDDGNGAIYPGAAEACNYTDENCALVDEGFNQPLTARNVADTVDGAPNDNFGFSVAGIGDVNGDGREDFAVGIYADDEVAGDSGSVLVYSGIDRSILCRAVDPGGSSSDWLGYSLAGLGDVTGDGTPDFAAGVVYDDTSEGTNAGSVVIFSGDDCAFVRKLVDAEGTAHAYLGNSVAAMPDITGDGRSEVVAGANGDDTARGGSAGTVLVFNGATGARIFKSFDPLGRANDQLGYSVTGMGDVDYDNVADFAGGARYDNNGQGNGAGSILLFSGADGSVIRELRAGSANDQVGHSLVRIEDIDSDGVDDVVTGVPYEDSENTNAGAVMIFSGADGSLIRLMTDPVGISSDYLGWSVAVMDDISGDGIQEVLAGVQQDDDAGQNTGSVLIFDPTNGDVLHRLTDPDAGAGDWLGNSVGAVSDLSGDGAPEILAGAHRAENLEETDVGKVVLFSFEADCDSDGVSPFGDDCDDGDAANFAGNTEICDAPGAPQDNDCDGEIDEDDDGDGADICADCDPANPLVYPGAAETCNGVDDDCDTFVDNGPDADSDGVEAPCDCEDGNGAIYPGAVEVCNYADENCALVDEGFDHPLAVESVRDGVDGAPSDHFGFALAGIGDVNGDGREDFAVGIYADDESLGDSGSVLVYSGIDRSILCRAVDPAAGSSDWLGYSVAGLGDVTGDGTPDFAAGAVYDDTSEGTNAGSVVIFSGDDCAFVRKLVDPDGTAHAYLGNSVAAMPDITGDGRSEVVAGANGDDTARGGSAGTVLVFNGATGARIFRSFDPLGRANDQLGYSVTGMGDVDYDNIADFAGGARYDNNLYGNGAGSILIFSGADGSVIRELRAGSGSDSVGHAVARIEDIDGDGVDDVVAGVPFEDHENTNAGAVMLFSGADGSLIRLMTDPVGTTSDYLGWSVAVMADISGDGIQEVIAGVQQLDDAATDGGGVVVFDPTNGNVLHKLTDPDAGAADNLGNAVAAVSDLSGDGAPEILAGAHRAESLEETDVGKVVIFSFETDCDGDGVSPFAADCDDDDANNYSGNPEVCDAPGAPQDNDCDGEIDEDDDGDGADICADCDPANPLIYPGAAESCNGVDDDCDTLVDNGPDADSDGTEAPCDCDDDDASINPGGAEVCNRRDDNCDGVVDEGFTGAIAFIKLSDPDGLAYDNLGQSATGIGDVNGDGAVDFAVGIHLDDEVGGDAGSVLVFSGGDRSVICRAVDPAGAGSDWLGYSVAGIGDVTGDGAPDFAAGAVYDDTSEGTNAGSVVIFSGDDCSFVRRLVDPDGTGHAYLGTSVAAMSDITGDGISEVVAGANGDDTARGAAAGTVLVFNGATGARIFKSFDPNGRANDQLGWSVTGLGDVNYDNVADFAAGARHDSNLFGNGAGSILLFSGADGSVIRELRAGSGSDQVGHAVASIEDIDGDGVDDVVAGVPYEDTETTNAGAVMLFSGADGSLIRLMTDPVGQGSDYLGWSVATMDDITGDGIQEVVAGVQQDDDVASNAGSLVVFDPTNGNVLQKLTDLDGQVNDYFGNWVANIGDIRDGGVAEFLGTSLGDDVGTEVDAGSLVLFSYDEYDCDSDGETPFSGDCNDNDDNTPGVEICDGLDNDCDGLIDEDFDADSDGVSTCTGDCDDNNATVYPGATEVVADGIDQNCDTEELCYEDLDGDSYGTASIVISGDLVCTDAGEAVNDTDCDDGAGAINPGATEGVADGVDQNCDTQELCYVDGDGDSYGTASTVVSADLVCTDAGEAVNDLDCDDGDDTINPDGTEGIADGVDQDCDGQELCYEDLDGDSYGTASTVASADLVCSDAGEAVNDTDCNDGDGGIHPGATEGVADGVDQDCDTEELCYEDLDGDSYGTASTVTSGDLVCTDAGESVNDTDCDDGANTINPGATEGVADGVDQDCDTEELCYEDGDGDSYGSSNTVTSADLVCTDGGESVNSTDCDDGDGAIHPGATEGVADGVDQDCDMQELCYADGDGDSYGTAATVASADLVCTDAGESVNTTDCDDTNDAIFPGATEGVADGVDQNCDTQELCYVDGDGDSYGTAATVVSGDLVCTDAGEAVNDTDCDDGDNGINPGATEIPGDGIDQNCDGFDGVVCFEDLDSDGYGSANTVQSPDPDCDDPGEADVDGDCNDADAAINPLAAEIPDDGIDQDCNGSDTITCFEDVDQDGYGSTTTVLADDESCDTAQSESANSNDCDDSAAAIHPGATEGVADGVDQNCDTEELCYADGDGDSYGTTGTVASVDLDCADAGESVNDTDCDDGADTVYPGATEVVADGVDQDCDSEELCYQDGDGDSYGSTNTVASADLVCTGAGESANDTDCADGDNTVHPGATEGVADGVDQDCDTQELCYVDGDGDSFGSTGTVASADLVCTDAGESDNDTDCDDGAGSVYPGATEVVADGVDQDCDTEELCYVDGDGDDYGTAATVASGDLVCTDAGEAVNDTDCDDGDNTINPGATEIPGDGIDQNCDGFDGVTCFEDLDSDGYGSSNTLQSPDPDCDDPGEADVDGDCDDADATVHPTAVEVPDDGVDQDCNGSDTVTCYEDVDQDGHGSATTLLADDGSCDTAESESANSNDCDDGDASRFPGNEEVCDGVDNDCDSAVPANEADGDSDGFRICEGDCDDANAGSYPGADELCDGLDNDCDGAVPADEANVDGDGFRICDGDCNDGNVTVYPGAAELCDGLDNDCNGSVPEDEVDGDEDGYRVCDGDCNDADGAINPGAAEICDDGIDNDCDGNTDLDDFDDCGSSRTICSTLGDQPSEQEVDEDLYMFTGTQGEEVDVLAIATNGFGRANLILVDAMSGEGSLLHEIDRGRFPNRITVTLPATGEYFIGVSEQPEVALLSGRRFSGDYCLTLDATMGGSVSMHATATVEGGDPVASEQPDVQPGRVPTAMRDSRVGAKKRGR